MRVLELIKQRSIHERISLICLISIAVSLPYSVKLCSICIIFFMAHWIVEGQFKEKLRIIKSHPLVWLFAGFYLIHIVWLFNTQDLKSGFFDLEKKLSLVLFPLAISTTVIRKKQLEIILMAFIGACFFACLVCYYAAYGQYQKDGVIDHFLLGELSNGVKIHRVYFSLYLLFCISILLYYITTFKLILQLKLLCYFFIIFFVGFILLMASRIAFLFIIVSFLPLTIYVLTQTKRFLLVGGVAVVFIAMVINIVLTNEKIKNSMEEIYRDLDKGNSQANTTGPNLRVIIWKCGIEVLRENLLVGTGIGDVDNELVKKYNQVNFRSGINERLNSHNQFLQTGIGIGIFGLLYFILNVFYPLYYQRKQISILYILFIFSVAFFCLSEAMLCTQKGVVFYSLFNSLFAFQIKETT